MTESQIQDLITENLGVDWKLCSSDVLPDRYLISVASPAGYRYADYILGSTDRDIKSLLPGWFSTIRQREARRTPEKIRGSS